MWGRIIIADIADALALCNTISRHDQPEIHHWVLWQIPMLMVVGAGPYSAVP